MKKILIIVSVLLSGNLFAQDVSYNTDVYANNNLTNNPTISNNSNDSKFNLGLKGQFGNFGLFGLEGEYILENSKFVNSLMFSASFVGTKLESDFGSVTGSGFELGFGARHYFNKNSLTKGFYVDAGVNYGSIKFDDKISITGGSFSVNGTYSYISLINASIGYKFEFNKFIVEPSISSRYNLELQPKGDIKNEDFNNYVFGGGLRLAYKF